MTVARDVLSKIKMDPLQLALFGKQKRAGRGSPEFNLHVLVANVLNRWAMPGWRWTHLPFGEYRGDPERAKITGARLKRMGTKKGWPDFILLAPRRQPEPGGVFLPGAHFLELKRKGGQLTDEQFALMEWMTTQGYEYKVCDNFTDAMFVLKNWGAIRASVSA